MRIGLRSGTSSDTAIWYRLERDQSWHLPVVANYGYCRWSGKVGADLWKWVDGWEMRVDGGRKAKRFKGKLTWKLTIWLLNRRMRAQKWRTNHGSRRSSEISNEFRIKHKQKGLKKASTYLLDEGTWETKWCDTSHRPIKGHHMSLALVRRHPCPYLIERTLG